MYCVRKYRQIQLISLSHNKSLTQFTNGTVYTYIYMYVPVYRSLCVCAGWDWRQDEVRAPAGQSCCCCCRHAWLSPPRGTRNLRLACRPPNQHAATSDCGFSAAVQRWWWVFFSPSWLGIFPVRWEAGQAESTFRVREGLRDPYCLHPSNFHPTRLLPYLNDTVLSLKASSSRRFLRRERTELNQRSKKQKLNSTWRDGTFFCNCQSRLKEQQQRNYIVPPVFPGLINYWWGSWTSWQLSGAGTLKAAMGAWCLKEVQGRSTLKAMGCSVSQRGTGRSVPRSAVQNKQRHRACRARLVLFQPPDTERARGSGSPGNVSQGWKSGFRLLNLSRMPPVLCVCVCGER